MRLLISGSDLGGARVESEDPQLSVGRVRSNPSGSYLFVDVSIDPATGPGRYGLSVVTPDGRVRLELDILKPLARDGRFQGFSRDDVFYLLMPDRFANGDPTNDDPAEAPGLFDRSRSRYYHGGDLRGVTEKLPYLADLGVTVLWLNPIYDNLDRLNDRQPEDDQPITDYHGYGAVDFYAVDEHLGSLDELRHLVDAAHQHGIKIIQDQVANHTGPHHPWVDAQPTATWFNGSPAQHLENRWQTWSLADPYATPQTRMETLEGWFVDVLPDLNQRDPDVARYLIQNSLWWVGVTGLDGIRQDTLPYVPRTFWRDWMAALRREYPRLKVVGEVFDGDAALVSFFQGGRAQYDGIDSAIDTLFDFPLYYAIRRAFTGDGDMRELPRALSRDHLYADPDRLLSFLGLHDVRRFMGEPGADRAGLRLAFTFLLTTRGIPLIYYGDEIALPGGDDPDNRRDFPGGWEEDPRDAFDAACRTPDEASVWNRVRTLARLRGDSVALRRGELIHLHADRHLYVFARAGEGELALVALNNGDGPVETGVGAAPLELAPGARLSGVFEPGRVLRVQDSRLDLSLPAMSAEVYLLESEPASRMSPQ